MTAKSRTADLLDALDESGVDPRTVIKIVQQYVRLLQDDHRWTNGESLGSYRRTQAFKGFLDWLTNATKSEPVPEVDLDGVGMDELLERAGEQLPRATLIKLAEAAGLVIDGERDACKVRVGGSKPTSWLEPDARAVPAEMKRKLADAALSKPVAGD